MDRSDDVNNCRSEATLDFSMMPDFIHMGQGVGHKYSSSSVRQPSVFVFEKVFSAASPAAFTVVPRPAYEHVSCASIHH